MTYVKSCFVGQRLGRLLFIQLFLLLFFFLPSAFKVRQKDALVQNPGSAFFREPSKALKLASVGIQPNCVCERLKSGEMHLSMVGFYKLSGIDLEWNGLAQRQISVKKLAIHLFMSDS